MIERGQSLPGAPSGAAHAGQIKRLTVKVPGSTANLGPGFDTLGLALNRYCTLNFEVLESNKSPGPFINLEGASVQDLPKDKTNLIYRVLADILKDDQDLLKRLSITIDSSIPLARGMGSSAAAIMGSVWAAYALSKRVPEQSNLLYEATNYESHSDNMAASLHGGLVVSAPSVDKKRIVTLKFRWPPGWKTIIAVPSQALSTKTARETLPQQVPYKDAVNNVQRIALLLAAVTNQDTEMMKEALHDRLHEPYRAKLVPQLQEIRELLVDLPVIGIVLSGAGSSVLTIVDNSQHSTVLTRLKDWGQTQKQGIEILDLEADHRGLQASYE